MAEGYFSSWGWIEILQDLGGVEFREVVNVQL